MSTELHTVPTFRGNLYITQFSAGARHGMALQLTQGAGDGRPDEPGFIQLTPRDIVELVPLLMEWTGVKRTPQADALEAVLLFHSGSPWDNEKKRLWLELTGASEATTKVLCDTVRAAMASAELPA